MFTPLPTPPHLRPAALLRAVALLLASGLASACSPVAPDDSEAVESEALIAEPSSCSGVVLDARRTYRPGSWSDGAATVPSGSLTFHVPAELPVTFGGAGHGKALFSYRLGTGEPTTCIYRGHGGNVYRFKRCRPGDVGGAIAEGMIAESENEEGAAPTLASADTFSLHIQNGDRHFSATAVRLNLPGRVDTSFCRGKTNFADRTLAGLGGNGRACSDCHMPSQNFQLTPTAARARFEEMMITGEDDPLFRPIDADDFRVNGSAANDYTNLIENGLVRVTILLPSNMKLLDCGSMVPCPASALPTSETVADIWRAVPSIFDVRITGPDGASPASPRGPNVSGGYQLDARQTTLQSQALGALRGHASITVDPPASWLDDVAEFQNALFSSARVKALSDAMAANTVPLPDPDPALDAFQTQGKVIFDRACGFCHGNLSDHPSGSTPTPQAVTRYHAIFATCPRPVDTVSPPRFVFAPCSASQMRNVRTYEITNSGVAPSGTPCGGPAPQPPCVTRVTTSDPGRMLLTGYPAPGAPGDFERMDTPSLRGISRTAPYFANNTAATLEDMLENYKQFFKRVAILVPAAPILTTQPGVVPPVHDRPFTDAEVPALLAYLRKI